MRALYILIKPVSGRCNMCCQYCFYADISAGREPSPIPVMSRSTLEKLICKALSEATGSLSLGFQGGEPTLAGLDFYRTAVMFVTRYNQRHIPVQFSIQTNGLLIDERWAAFLAENDFLTGLSIDGPKSIHDTLRPDASGRGTHTRVRSATRLLRRAGASYNVLTVVTKALAAHPEKAYKFCRQEGLSHIQWIPCLPPLRGAPETQPYALDADSFGKFLCRTFDLWYADFHAGKYFSIRSFENYIRILTGGQPENCAMCGICHPYPVIEADGGVYPCDFYTQEHHLLGNISTHSIGEMLCGNTAHAFAVTSQQVHPDCAICPYFQLCRGGCRRDREPFEGGSPTKNRLCTAYRRFFAHALPRMQQVAKRMFPSALIGNSDNHIISQ